MPEIRRNEPPYLQIANHYRHLIVTGELSSGARLPALREIASEWQVALATAGRAIEHLKVASLVHAEGNIGIFVNGGQVRLTPQDRLEAVKAGGALYLRTEHAEVMEAGLVPAPEYVASLLGLEPGTSVARRQQLFRDPDGTAAMLAVSWFQPAVAEAVPELLQAAPVPGETGEIGLITGRTGRAVTHAEESYRGRVILDDGREGPLLGLPQGSACLAGVWVWSDSEDVLEYGEFVLPPDKVISYRHDFG